MAKMNFANVIEDEERNWNKNVGWQWDKRKTVFI